MGDGGNLVAAQITDDIESPTSPFNMDLEKLSHVVITRTARKQGDETVEHEKMNKHSLTMEARFPIFVQHGQDWKCFYSDIMAATNGFNASSSNIGKGDMRVSSKPNFDRTVMAMKMIDSTSKQGKKKFAKEMRIHIIFEICLVLIVLPSRSMVHGDLKLANILFDSNFNNKLFGFGLYCFLLET